MKLVRLTEITMMTGALPAANPAVPQAALGDRPSDAYRNQEQPSRKHKKKKKRLKKVK